MGKRKFIFVGGAGRSGTTLVQKILLSHDKITGGPEFGYTQTIFELYKQMKIGLYRNAVPTYLKKERLEKSFELFYSSFFYNYSDPNAVFISEKTPSNVIVINELLECFEDAIFINVFRDGRAVLASHLKVKQRAKKEKKYVDISLKSTCRLWNSSIRNYLNATKKYKERIHSICYESLIETPENELNSIFSFIGLEPDSKMLNPEHIEFSDKKHDAHINNVWYTEEMYKQSFNTTNINKWKDQLNFIQKVYANSLMANNLSKMGYDISPLYIKINKIIEATRYRNIKDRLKKTFLFKLYKKIL